jgi:H+-transporting ATPase
MRLVINLIKIFLLLNNQQRTFNVRPLGGNKDEMMSALYLQVSIIRQALIFVTRSRSWSFTERPGYWLCGAFVIAQIVSLAVHSCVEQSLA